MVTFERWYDSIGDNKLQEIIETIEDLELPYKLKEVILNTTIDAEWEILEDMYDSVVGEYQDRCYDEYKDSKYE